MSAPLILALPSKGRLMEQCANMLAKAGLVVAKSGAARGYKGDIAGLPGVEVNFVSSSEIAQLLKSGAAHLGITGEDLLRETIADCDERITFLRPCGFGQADVVVAVPAAWIDVRHMSDLEEMALSYRRVHGRRVRVATKYMNLTRRFFSTRASPATASSRAWGRRKARRPPSWPSSSSTSPRQAPPCAPTASRCWTTGSSSSRRPTSCPPTPPPGPPSCAAWRARWWRSWRCDMGPTRMTRCTVLSVRLRPFQVRHPGAARKRGARAGPGRDPDTAPLALGCGGQ